MKTNFFLTIIAALLIASASCKSKAQKDAEDYMNKIDKTVKENSPDKTNDQQNTRKGSFVIPQGMENIVGEWELVGGVVDTNDNLQIDDDERKKLESPGYKDYMKLNRDGSGLFTAVKMDGLYEITDPKSDGKKLLTWYDGANGPHKIGTIIKITKEELHIKEVGGSGLFIWKRL